MFIRFKLHWKDFTFTIRTTAFDLLIHANINGIMVYKSFSLLCDPGLIMAHLVFSNTAKKKDTFSKLFLDNAHVQHTEEIHRFDTMVYCLPFFSHLYVGYCSLYSLVT